MAKSWRDWLEGKGYWCYKCRKFVEEVTEDAECLECGEDVGLHELDDPSLKPDGK